MQSWCANCLELSQNLACTLQRLYKADVFTPPKLKVTSGLSLDAKGLLWCRRFRDCILIMHMHSTYNLCFWLGVSCQRALLIFEALDLLRKLSKIWILLTPSKPGLVTVISFLFYRLIPSAVDLKLIFFCRILRGGRHFRSLQLDKKKAQRQYRGRFLK